MRNSRLLKELKAATQGGPNDTFDHVVTSLQLLDESNLNEWVAVLSGPEGTPYCGGRFRVRLSVPASYPLAPPTATFVTPIFHPNVHFSTGEVCLDILKTDWSPAWTLMSVCRAIVALLSDPAGGADSPLNCDAGNLVRGGDMRAFDCVARMYTVELAQSYT
jgi:peroxin-4